MENEIKIGELIKGLSYVEYARFSASQRALRSSYLQHLRKSPAHLKASLQEGERDAEHFRVGRLVHTALENPEKFLETYVMEPVFTGKTKDGKDSERSAEAREKKLQWYAGLPPGTAVVKTKDIDMIKGIFKSVKEHKLVKNLLKEGVSETSLWVREPATGITMACRPDFIASAGYIIDIKTTRSAYPDDFVNEIFSPRGWFYILQAAHYTRCAKIAGLKRPDTFTFIAIEKTAPYCLNVFPLDAGHLDVGDQILDKLIKTYAECLSTDKWPGYEERSVPVELPGWVRWEQQMGVSDVVEEN